MRPRRERAEGESNRRERARPDARCCTGLTQKPLNFAAVERSLSPSVMHLGRRMAAPCEHPWSGSMPIIIDEIVISVEVTNKLSAGGGATAGADSEVIIEQCVERVLERLREQEERRT